MFIIKALILNALLSCHPIMRWARRLQPTGIDGDSVKALEAFNFYSSFINVEGKRVLELGIGKTLEVLLLAKAAGAISCHAADVVALIDPAKATKLGIDYRIYDGRRLPFDDGSMDVVLSFDVLEHVRKPEAVIDEMFRVLVPGGHMVHRIDLRDHYHLENEACWFECIKYPTALWNAMTWNRSSFINRLRQSDWQAMVEGAGFYDLNIRPFHSELLALSKERHLQRLSPEDKQTYKIDIHCNKPSAGVRKCGG